MQEGVSVRLRLPSSGMGIFWALLQVPAIALGQRSLPPLWSLQAHGVSGFADHRWEAICLQGPEGWRQHSMPSEVCPFSSKAPKA